MKEALAYDLVSEQLIVLGNPAGPVLPRPGHDRVCPHGRNSGSCRGGLSPSPSDARRERHLLEGSLPDRINAVTPFAALLGNAATRGGWALRSV